MPFVIPLSSGAPVRVVDTDAVDGFGIVQPSAGPIEPKPPGGGGLVDDLLGG